MEKQYLRLLSVESLHIRFEYRDHEVVRDPPFKFIRNLLALPEDSLVPLLFLHIRGQKDQADPALSDVSELRHLPDQLLRQSGIDSLSYPRFHGLKNPCV